MPAVPAALAALVQSKVDTRMQSVQGISPLGQENPSYYIEMCQAIGMGLIIGSPVIAFTTTDSGVMGAPPVPGVGSGVGIVTDPTFFVEDLYTRVRGYIQSELGETAHDPYPPSSGNSGEFLLALCNGINDAIMTYYPTSWTLVSAHPLIYVGSGQITDGNFSGLSAPAIASSIQGLAPNFVGKFWPKMCQAISESYVALIEQHSTGMVTIVGVCVPSLAQVCGIGSSGTGSGTAT